MAVTNITPATAFEFPTPYDALLDASGATPTNYDLWFKYTFTSDLASVGFWAYTEGSGNYIPFTSTFIGTPDALTPYLLSNVDGAPVQLPSPGETVYFRVRNSTGLLPDVPLIVSALKGPGQAAPIASIFINDDTDGFPAVILDGTTGEALQIRPNFPNGEAGDVLATGEILLEDATNNNLKLFDTDFSVIATIAEDADSIRTQRAQQLFYIAIYAANTVVKTINAAGVVGGTTWSLTANTTAFAIAANNAGTILYFSNNNAGSALKRWNLSTNTALSNLVGVTAAPAYYIQDILVLADDTVIASYVVTISNTVQVRHYSTAGVLLNTYGPYSTTIPGGTQPRLAYTPASSLSFWLWIHPSVGLSRFLKIQVSDGTVLQTVESTEYEGGIDQGGTGTRFGNSFSCPFLLTTVEYPPFEETPETEYTTEELIPRRQRRAPYLSADQVMLFFDRFEVVLESGLGLTSGQGEDPIVNLSWTDDGGHTWSDTHPMSAGRRGEYPKRVFLNRLGRARNRSFQIDVSDPIGWQVLSGIVDITKGDA